MTIINQKQQFLSIVNEYSGIIHKVSAIYADSREDKEDLFQEIVYQCWKSFPRFKNESKVSTWIYRVSLNTALVYQRDRKKVKTQSIENPKYQPVDDSLNDGHLKSALMQAIKSLDKADRMIITLHLDGYNNQEISEMVGTTKGNTAVKLHRIKEQLKLKLKEEK